jgi:hypothetical protein
MIYSTFTMALLCLCTVHMPMISADGSLVRGERKLQYFDGDTSSTYQSISVTSALTGSHAKTDPLEELTMMGIDLPEPYVTVAPAPTTSPTTAPTTSAPTKNPTTAPTGAPSDVRSEAPSDVSSDGSSGMTAGMVDTSGYPELDIVGNNFNPPEAYPLGECEGDCDDDNECSLGLICMFRKGNETVPGCRGDAVDSKDYCYRPGPGLLVVMANYGEPSENYPLKECQADCDYDFDCDFGLSCFQRDDYETVPGCKGWGQSGYDYCYVPKEGTLILQGINGYPETAYPMAKCTGDCRGDYDCEEGLSCLIRMSKEPVPGCFGMGVPSLGYCYDPDDSIIITDSPTASPTKDATRRKKADTVGY